MSTVSKNNHDAREAARGFWESAGEYPNFAADIKRRRLHELNYLVPQLEGVRTILDLGCGDGALIKCLRQVTAVEKFFAYDLSPGLLRHLEGEKGVETKVYDCYEAGPLPEADVTIMGNVLLFFFEDETVSRLLAAINSPVVFIRVTCTLKDEDEFVNTFSKDLEANYAALYRTLPHVLDILRPLFRIEAVDRIYPDSIESKYGTKQFYIKGTRK